MQSRLQALSKQVQKRLRKIDRETAQVQLATGIRCREACGECCLNDEVEARPIEMLPLVFYLKKLNKLELYYSLSKKLEGQSCLFYAASAFDQSLGRCSVYSKRPSLCRLFGFSGTRNKYGQNVLASCHWHKKLQPEETASANEQLKIKNIPLPLMQKYQFLFEELSPSSQWASLLPINRAFRIAAEKVLQSFDHENPSQPTNPSQTKQLAS